MPTALAAVLDVPVEEIGFVRSPGPEGGDLLISAVDHLFAIDVKRTSVAGILDLSVRHIVERARVEHAIPLLAVPFMGDLGKQLCRSAGASWFDYSGNAHIVAPGIRVIIAGRPNLFQRPGRPSSVFGPKSSRVARFLLMHPGETATQREISRATGVSEGFVSRISSRLDSEHYVSRDERGALRLTNPALLLDAWQEKYRFSKHTLIPGHVAARSGVQLSHMVSDCLETTEIEYAATGLSAAWEFTQFAMFRIATFFLDADPDDVVRENLGFRQGLRGANLWFVIPNDAGVFQGAEARNGVRCVHPVQAYLDLKEHPERASEAAERLRADFLFR